MTRTEFFEKRVTSFEEEKKKYESDFKNVSYIRVTFTLISIALIIFFANERNGLAVGLIAIVAPIIFGLMVKWHNKVREARDRARILSDINRGELNRLKLDLTEFDGGIEFQDSHHEYSSDLDLYGDHSLFQLLNRTSTLKGRLMLKDWLNSPSDSGQIRERQAAVNELKERPEWLQNFQSEGLLSGDQQQSVDKLLEWLEQDDKKYFSLNRTMAILLAAITTTCFVLVYLGFFSYGFLIFPLALNTILLSRIFVRLKDITELTYEGAKSLKSYGRLIQSIDGTSFNSKKLVELRSRFRNNSYAAGHAIGGLNRLLDVLNSRANLFYVLFNITFLLDFLLSNSINNWKDKYGTLVRNWFDTLAEFESLVSIAGFAFANESYTQSQISDQEYHLEAKEIGHPLIDSTNRVSNNVSMEGSGSIVIVTGSNMSGKSTFLRTIGINMVLTYLGAPVCADSFEISELRLYTSMRTTDKLEENISSFYAELKRLKGLIEAVDKDGPPMMYMVDEVLKGTNSADRHLGAKSLVKQLSLTRSIGWVSTHDLTLGDMDKDLNQVTNMSFNSRLDGDSLIFDYKLTPGVCQTFNASVLMKKMGIDLLNQD